MKLFSINSLPPGNRVRQVFDIIVHTGTVSLSNRARGSLDERSESVRQQFAALAPDEANAIIGVGLTTNVVLFDIGGGGDLYLTYCGNPAVIDEDILGD